MKKRKEKIKSQLNNKLSKKVILSQRENFSSSTEGSYTAKDIYVLKGLEPVRKRPGMYIGSTGIDGLHHLVWEVTDNCLDEIMAGYAKNIEVRIFEGERVSILDDGRGIPVDIHPQTKKSALETVMCTLHAGGKFGGQSYKIAGGLHGVGVSVVNALSRWLRVEVCRNGYLYSQEYSYGKPTYNLKKEGKCQQTGTKVIFDPDPQIFSKIKFDFKTIIDHLREQAYLTPGATIRVFDERKGAFPQSYIFHFESGIVSFIHYLVRNYSVLTKNIFYTRKEIDNIFIEISLVYIDDTESMELSFANNIHTHEGGMHLTGFRSALTRTLNDYARQEKFFKNEEIGFLGDDVREGLVAIISVKLREPQFEGQTKAKLGNPEVRTAVEQILAESFKEWLEKNKDDSKKIIEKCLLTARARRAAKAARENILRKGVLAGASLPGKLADCISRKAEESEIFLVEGESAGGCFSGDTRVALIDGRNLTFKELIKEYQDGKKNYCYTIKKDGNVGIEEIKNPRMTKKSSEVIKVILDNDEEIICTPDHKFMLRDGSYKKAVDLTTKDSLMPLYRKHSEIGGKITIAGFEMVFNSKDNKWISIHLLADKYNLKRGVYSRRNNDAIHLLEKTIHQEDVKEKCRQISQSGEFKEKIRNIVSTPQMRAILSMGVKKQWQNKEYKNYMVQKFLEFYNSNAENREKNNKLLNEVQKKYWSSEKNRKKQTKRVYNQTYLRKALLVLYEIYKKTNSIDQNDYNQIRKLKNDKNLIRYDAIYRRFFNGNEEKLKEAVLNYNHRIKAIISLKEKIDVYDIEIPETHNFALASGVFVHNSAKSARDRRFQAILPLRGKILNVEKARLDKIMASEEIRLIIIALGTAIAEDFDLKKLRYQRIIIMSDADVDGAHIRTLLLTLFYRHFRILIENGYLYIAQPPLYKIQKGKEIHYVYNEGEKEKIIKSLVVESSEEKKNKAAKIRKLKIIKNSQEETVFEIEKNPEKTREKTEEITAINIQRYKGLGEMNPDQLWETTMNPQQRVLKKVTIEDAEEADRLFDILMGEEVLPRKKFIQAYAQKVKDLDV